jgi:hypothetical protein
VNGTPADQLVEPLLAMSSSSLPFKRTRTQRGWIPQSCLYVTEKVTVVLGVPVAGVTAGLSRLTGAAARTGTTAAMTIARAMITEPVARSAGPDLSC